MEVKEREIIKTLRENDIAMCDQRLVGDSPWAVCGPDIPTDLLYMHIAPLAPLEPYYFPIFHDSVRLYCPVGELW